MGSCFAYEPNNTTPFDTNVLDVFSTHPSELWDTYETEVDWINYEVVDDEVTQRVNG